MKILFVILLCLTSSYAQDIFNNYEFNRNYYSQLYFGLPELSSLTIGKDLTKDISLAIKTNIFPQNGHGDGPRGNLGIGLKISKIFSRPLLNNSIFPIDVINLEICSGIYKNSSKLPINYNLNIGSEKILSQGINFTWNIGVMLVAEKSYNSLVLPMIRLGINCNY